MEEQILDSSSEVYSSCDEIEISHEPLQNINSIYSITSQIYKIKIKNSIFYRIDLERLLPNGWLNDKIINSYMKIIAESFENVFCFSSFIFSYLRKHGAKIVGDWFKNENIFDYKYLLFPIHLSNHWALVIVCHEYIIYYDSLGVLNLEPLILIKNMLKKLYFDRFKVSKKFYGKNMASKLPKQQNGDDCGVFCCMYARFFVDPNISKIFQSERIPEFRKKILHEILIGKIIYDYSKNSN